MRHTHSIADSRGLANIYRLDDRDWHAKATNFNCLIAPSRDSIEVRLDSQSAPASGWAARCKSKKLIFAMKRGFQPERLSNILGNRFPLDLDYSALKATDPERAFILNHCKLELAVFKQFDLVNTNPDSIFRAQSCQREILHDKSRPPEPTLNIEPAPAPGWKREVPPSLNWTSVLKPRQTPAMSSALFANSGPDAAQQANRNDAIAIELAIRLLVLHLLDCFRLLTNRA